MATMTKEAIVKEIRRTAEANGGTALGRERFARETGIRESDWYGRYWAGWSEAVTEAGYPPNEWNAAYEDEWLVRKYAELAMHLGRLPRSVDLRLARRSDPSFPSHNVFGRLGNKAQLTEKMLTFCRDHEEFATLIPFCTAGPDTSASTPDVSRQPDVFGFVYLMKSGRHYKIGKSNAVGRREREVALQLPERVNVIHAIRTDDPGGIEAYWHARFASKRVNGEWFVLTADDVSAFRRRKFM